MIMQEIRIKIIKATKKDKNSNIKDKNSDTKKRKKV